MRDPKGDRGARSSAGGVAAWPLWLRALVLLCIIAALIAPLVIWRDRIIGVFAERRQVVALIRAAGAWGPIAVIGLAIAQTIVAPIPGQVVNVAAGYLFGFWLGTLSSWLGSVLGSTLAMALARAVGRPLVTRLVGPGLLGRLDRLAAGGGLRFFFLVFLIPGLPDDAACFLAGLTPLPLPALILAAAVGRVPGILAAVWAGAFAGAPPVAGLAGGCGPRRGRTGRDVALWRSAAKRAVAQAGAGRVMRIT